MNRQHISDMLRMQDKMNSVVNPSWLTADYPWYRAMMVEAVEALDHYGWKWWKATPQPDLAQVKIELVDIWHFALSHILAIHEGDFEAAATEIADYFTKLEADPDAYGEVSTVPPAKLFDLLAGSAALQRQLNGPAFNALLGVCGMSWDELYTTYVAKNVLNLFRQANGYKEGTYIKSWGGVEDNVVLEHIMGFNPDATPAQLMDVLAAHYDVVKTGTPA